MAIGDEFDPAQIKPYDFAMFARRIEMPRTVLVREMRRLAQAVTAHAPNHWR